MPALINYDKEALRAELLGSLLEFCKTFFPLLTGRDFIVSSPLGRESHIIIICRELVALHRGELETPRLLINVPPGHFKSTLLCMFVGWCFAHNPRCNFLYISYSKPLAVKHTATIKQLLSLRHYQYLFDVKISSDSKAKEYFKTEQGGHVSAYGSSGSITGQDAGLPQPGFNGAVIMDDMHKPDEVFSDTLRQSVIDNYLNTITKRARHTDTAFICLAQRLHEDDICQFLKDGRDGYKWRQVILQSLDAAGNALFPEVFPKDMLLKTKEFAPYVFAAQDQQEPAPAGGSVFKPEWFYLLDDEPELLQTFICCDTAETAASHNDATVFSFFGIYKIKQTGVDIEQLALHWIDCYECRVEPKDLENEFLTFWADCMRHKVQPSIAVIEKKSTGVTLSSILQSRRGLQIRSIERTRASGSKAQRYLEIQPLIAKGLVSFTKGARHSDMCLRQAEKITANDTHRHDDIIDTLYDGCKIALIDKSLYTEHKENETRRKIISNINRKQMQNKRLRSELWQR